MGLKVSGYRYGLFHRERLSLVGESRYLPVLWGEEARAQEERADPDIRITRWNSRPDIIITINIIIIVRNKL